MSTGKERTVLVTGATKGIGFEVARELAAGGARVILHARTLESGREAVEQITSELPRASLELVTADLRSVDGVRSLAHAVLTTAPQLHVLINNAGAMYHDFTLTEEGVETTFAVNHLSAFLLTNLLLERLKASAPARIITVASEAHRGMQINFTDVNLQGNYSAMKALGQSKLANIMFTRALARRLGDCGVSACCVHPGHVRTAFTRDLKGGMRLFVAVLRMTFISAREGAAPIVWLAAEADGDQVNGKYFNRSQLQKPSPEAEDEAAAEKLWELSERITGLA